MTNDVLKKLIMLFSIPINYAEKIYADRTIIEIPDLNFLNTIEEYYHVFTFEENTICRHDFCGRLPCIERI